jgi:SAM-dependent methyltransferase
MALPILESWKTYFDNHNEGLGSSYERVILNNLLLSLKVEYDITEVIEVPIFGFTGITGLNSLDLYSHGCNVTLIDQNPERVDKVRQIFEFMHQEVQVLTVNSYSTLPFKEKNFDMAWNFSALWFVEDLNLFLSELSRITRKIILLCVPNQSGLGYLWQKTHTDIPEGICFHEEYINPILIKQIMNRIGWRFVREAYIDCPPWPDIGMSKEKFMRNLLGKTETITKENNRVKPISIIDYYRGLDNGFPGRMLKYSILEKIAPLLFKKFWSHHKWMLFENK